HLQNLTAKQYLGISELGRPTVQHKLDYNTAICRVYTHVMIGANCEQSLKLPATFI
ncbi:unnamed protein product, partial [Hymenolepis diminuta]